MQDDPIRKQLDSLAAFRAAEQLPDLLRDLLQTLAGREIGRDERFEDVCREIERRRP